MLSAFELLQRPSGPVLEDFPEGIEDEADSPLTCPLPPRLDARLPKAVDEARGLRSAYERERTATGRTTVGRAVDTEHIPDAVAAFVRVANGELWQDVWREVGFTAEPPQVQSDVRAYYEEAAMALADHVPAARQAESWFYRHTETGAVLRRAQSALRQQKYPVWAYFIPSTQSDELQR
jgi:hypothetical protein